MTYVSLRMELGGHPGRNDRDFRVTEDSMDIGEVYGADASVGSLPSTVYRTVAPEAPVRMTLCVSGYVGLIRFRGHLPKGGYDVRNGRDTQPTAPSAFHG